MHSAATRCDDNRTAVGGCGRIACWRRGNHRESAVARRQPRKQIGAGRAGCCCQLNTATCCRDTGKCHRCTGEDGVFAAVSGSH